MRKQYAEQLLGRKITESEWNTTTKKAWKLAIHAYNYGAGAKKLNENK